MLKRLRNSVLDTPLEKLARRLYLRLDRSPAGMAEKDTLVVLKRSLKKDSNCIDIGAHRGSILGEITARAPRGRHYAFEPVPRHCAYLVKHFPRVEVRQMAVSNQRGTRQFAHVVNRPTRSGFIQPPDEGNQVETITVEVEALDHVIPEGMRIDLIKIDVEGAEYEVIQGAVETIRRSTPLLLIEFSIESSAWYGTKAVDMYRLLTETCGLSVWRTKDWIHEREALTCDAFVQEVEGAKSFYFVAGVSKEFAQ